jgi:hypothetical protein
MRVVVVILFSLFSSVVYGQDLLTDNIVWSIDNLRDSTSSESMPFVCQFKVYPVDEKIEWIQNGGDYVSIFQIRDTEKDWADVSGDGSIEYKVKYQGKSGFFRIERSSSSFHIKLFIMEGSKNLLPLTLHISSFSVL